MTLKQKYNFIHSDGHQDWNRSIDSNGIVRILDIGDRIQDWKINIDCNGDPVNYNFSKY